MAVIDDTFLNAIFGAAGDAFEVPADGMDEILQRALHSDAPLADEVPEAEPIDELRTRRVISVARQHRLLSVAAVVVLVGILTGAGLIAGRVSTPTPVPADRSLQAGGTLHGAPTSTTTPQLGVAASGTGGTTASPAPKAASTASGASVGASSGGAGSTGFSADTPASGGTVTSALPNGAVGQSAKVEQTGSLDLTVAKGTLTAIMAKLSYLATAANGFVANSQTTSGASSDGPPAGTVTLQVPVSSFDAVLKEAQSLGKVSQLTTKATDVTGQYVDLQARITALQDSRQQYLTIMSKANSVGDVLAVQSQLDSLQQQIEQLQGQLQVLTGETAFSTLTIALSEKTSADHHHVTHHASGLQKAWHASIHGFTAGVDGLVRLAGPLLFALLCLAVLVFGGRVLWRRVQRHNL